MRTTLIIVWLTFLANVGFPAESVTNPPPAKTSEEFKQPKTLAELLAIKPEELENVDIARMNLLCAEGLLGAEDLDVEKSLDTLDRWAKHVERETLRNYHRFIEHPEEYENSEAYYRMMMLAMVLQEDFRTHYDPERALPQVLGKREPNDIFYADASDVFIHGLLGGARHGTCSSLPVLYVAVARHLGYPVNLVSAEEHLYLRYEAGTNHLNVDAAGEGFITHPDEEYRKWPHPLTDEEIKTYGFLQPMSQQRVLGAFLAIRAGCLTSMKKFDEAAASWEAVNRYLPTTPVLQRIVELAKERASDTHKAERWEELWYQIVHQPIPDEAVDYFQNRQAQILFFMNHNTDLTAIEKAATALKDEVDKYAKEKTTDIHKVQFRISFVPPPVRLLQTPNLDDPVASMEFSQRRIRIRAERVPPAYWQSIPPELQTRLNGLNNEEQIISDMNSYYAEEMNRRSRQVMGPVTAKPQQGQIQPFTPGVPNLPLTKPPVRIEIIPPQTGTP